jgi:ElaB/YqjD/DUF883 family membrane-anchored ribosome-binding protein
MDQSLNAQYKDLKNGAAKAGDNFADEVKSGASKAVGTVIEKVKTGAEDLSNELKTDQMKERLMQLRDQAEDQVEVAASFVKKYPIACIAGAAVLGFAIGKYLTRK